MTARRLPVFLLQRAAIALLLLLSIFGAQAAERRLALVIGNSGYRDAPLLNPGNDARAMAQVLREAGFTVMERRNLNQAAMRGAIREFGDALAKGGVGLFFYAGHGMQVKGRNFMIPIGHDIRREDEVEDQSVDVGLVLQKMASARNALNILILDACRNNPFGFGSTAQGLAPLDAPAGTLVAFATAPGQVAADGTDDNSVYTKHLAAYMREPGLKVEDTFKRVRAAVRQESGGRQVPWENTSLETDFYFRPPDPKVIAAQEEERRQAQQVAIERAVQEALTRRSERNAQERAKLEREIAERLASERAAAERAAQERARLERELSERMAVARASNDRSLAQQQDQQKAQKEAIDKAVQEGVRRAEERAAQERAKLEREMAERMAAERAAARRAAQQQIAEVERAVQDRIAAVERAAQEAIERARQEVLKSAPVAAPAQPKPADVPPVQVAVTGSASEVKPAPPAAAKVAVKPAVESPPASTPQPAQAGPAPEQEPVRLALAAPSTAAIPAARAMILPKVGDTWTYKVTTRDYGQVSERRSTSTVGAVTDSEIHFGRDRIGVRYNHDWNLLYNRGNDGLERTYTPYVPLFAFPLEPGKSWQARYKMSRSDGRIYDFDMSVTTVGWESVTVPAGTFKAIKLSSINWYRRTDPGGSGGGRVVVNRWYAPEVKRFVKSETLDMGNNNVVYNDNTWELVSYKVQ